MPIVHATSSIAGPHHCATSRFILQRRTICRSRFRFAKYLMDAIGKNDLWRGKANDQKTDGVSCMVEVVRG
jgi:hypothetical protein